MRQKPYGTQGLKYLLYDSLEKMFVDPRTMWKVQIIELTYFWLLPNSTLSCVEKLELGD